MSFQMRTATSIPTSLPQTEMPKGCPHLNLPEDQENGGNYLLARTCQMGLDGSMIMAIIGRFSLPK